MSTIMQSDEISTTHSSVTLSLLTFPEKLWNLVENPKCEEIRWSDGGQCIFIPHTPTFIRNILHNPSKQIFKTKNFSSFVRQLNLYGFRKVTERRGKSGLGEEPMVSEKCKFRHPFFQSGRRDFLTKVKRNYQPVKKCATTSQSTVDRLLNESGEASVLAPWNPAMLYPTAPYLPAFGPQMPMPPLHPLFQFPDALHGGVMERGLIGPQYKWEYGPSAPGFQVPPASSLEAEIKNAMETVATWSGAQRGVIPATNEQQAPQPFCHYANQVELPQQIMKAAGSPAISRPSIASTLVNPGPMAPSPWPVSPEKKQPLPAQNSAVVVKSEQDNPQNNGEVA